MGRLKNYWLAWGLAYLCSSVCICGSVRAHPVDLGNYDRTIDVQVTAEGVIVAYRLEISPETAVKDLVALDNDEVKRLTRPREFYSAFTRAYAPIFAANLIGKLDGEELPFTCIRHEHEVLDHLRCDFVFRANWQLRPGQPHEFTFREGNYVKEIGLIRLSLANHPATPFARKDAPSEILKARPFAEWKPGDETRLRTAAATFEVIAVAPKHRPDESAAEPFARLRMATDDRPKGWFKPEQAPEAAVIRTAPAPEEPAAATHHADSLLRLFLHSEQGFWMMLLAAVGLGAAHALTPGHGKTLVAAYLVGQRGTVWHALLLGIVTTLTHTGVVLLLAGALGWYFPRGMTPETQRGVDAALGLIGGLLIAGLGIWLLLRRLSGQADHFHLPGQGHHHHHGHTHSHELPKDAGAWGLIVLGVHGGIVPCWDAVVVLLAAVAMNLLWLALPLLLAFSAGLAGVLILIGILVVKTRGLLGARFGESRLFQLLPLVSAVVIIGLGLWLCFDRVQSRP